MRHGLAHPDPGDHVLRGCDRCLGAGHSRDRAPGPMAQARPSLTVVSARASADGHSPAGAGVPAETRGPVAGIAASGFPVSGFGVPGRRPRLVRHPRAHHPRVLGHVDRRGQGHHLHPFLGLLHITCGTTWPHLPDCAEGILGRGRARQCHHQWHVPCPPPRRRSRIDRWPPADGPDLSNADPSRGAGSGR